MIKLFISICLFFSTNCLAQSDTAIYDFASVDTLPQFPGGEDAMYNFILSKGKEIKISMDDPNIHGVAPGVLVKFTIDHLGNISKIQLVLSSKSKELDDKSVALMKKMPKWKPAIKNEINVTSYFIAPFTFSISYTVQKDKQHDETKREQIEKAEESFRLAVVNYYYNEGLSNFKSKQFKRAVYYFNLALQYNPDDIDALYNKSISYLKLNENGKACDSLQKIKALGKPDADDLIKKYCSN